MYIHTPIVWDMRVKKELDWTYPRQPITNFWVLWAEFYILLSQNGSGQFEELKSAARLTLPFSFSLEHLVLGN